MGMRVALLALVALWSTHATAANPERWGPSMLPTNGVRLDFGNSENRLTASINRLFFQGPLGPLRLGLALSAPTTETSQPSASRDPGYYPFGYSGRISIAWDTLYETRYAVRVPLLLRQRLCALRKQGARPARGPCDARALELWIKQHRKQVKQWQRAKRLQKGWLYKWRRKQRALQQRRHTLRELTTSLLALPYTKSLARACQPLIKALQEEQPTLFQQPRPFLSEQKACLFVVGRERAALQKAALTHRLLHLKRFRKLKADAALYEAIRKFQAAMEQRQRDLSRRLPPVLPASFRRSLFYSLGLEVFASFQQLSAFSTIKATRMTDYLGHTLQIGPTFALYLSPRWAFHLRAGIAYQAPVTVENAKRCRTLPGANGVQGQRRCESVRVLEKPITPEAQLYVRGAVTALFDLDCCSTTLGVELRAGLENLSFAAPRRDTLLELQLVLFSVSRITSILGRFHIGVHMGIPIGEGASLVSLESGFFVLPFVGFGAGI